MPASIVRGPATPDKAYLEQKREVDRWRVAVELVRRLREAGFRCELGDLSETCR
jgi:hypothetical protein